MNDLLMIGLILIAWVALNRWILPALGIQTCMSGGGCCGGSCRTAARPARVPLPEEQEGRQGSGTKNA